MLQPGASLRVHSVFERALNLVDAEGGLLTLLGPGGGNGPATLVLDAPPTASFSRAGPALGQAARVEQDGRLVVPGWLTVGRDAVQLWRPERPLVLAAPPQRRANLERAVVLAGGASDGLGGLLAHRQALLADRPASAPAGLTPLLSAGWSALVELLPAWRRGDAAAVGAAARRLVGLGPGQTPSGDDLLAGLIAASRRLAPDDPRWEPFAAALGAAARGRTTDLGFARLRYAAAGDLDERTEQTLTALLTAADSTGEGVERATRNLLGYGHTSGLDTLVGLVLGVAISDP
jgi:uncharacterized protein DUF2877